MRRIVPTALVAVLALWGCGPKAITKGSRPFPSEKAIFTDASGKTLSALPDSGEDFRLVFLDFPSCPACDDAWRSVRAAVEGVSPGKVRIYRVLFDREILITASGKKEATPMRPVPPPWPESPEGERYGKVTTLTALPAAFREEYRVNQVPILLLIDRTGKVERRWNGYSTMLKEELSSELKKTAPLPGSPPG